MTRRLDDNTKQWDGTIRLTNPALVRAFKDLPNEIFNDTYPIKEARRWTKYDSVRLTAEDIRQGVALLRLRYLATGRQQDILMPMNNLLSMRSKLADPTSSGSKDAERVSLIFDVTPEEFTDVLEAAKTAMYQQPHHVGRQKWQDLVDRALQTLAGTDFPEMATAVIEQINARPHLCDPCDSDRRAQALRLTSDSGQWRNLLGGDKPLGRG